MTPNSPFEITRRSPSGNASNTYALAAVRGLALGAHLTNADAFALASGNNFIGHLTRDVAVGDTPLTDLVFGRTSATPVGAELPFRATEEVSVEKADEIEVEGVDLIMTSGTGAIDTNTAVGTGLSFKQGKLYVAQSGDAKFYLLTANNLTPSESGALRIRAERA